MKSLDGARRRGVGVVLGFDLGIFKVAVFDEVLVAHLHLGEAVAGVEDGEDEDSEHVHPAGRVQST